MPMLETGLALSRPSLSRSLSVLVLAMLGCGPSRVPLPKPVKSPIVVESLRVNGVDMTNGPLMIDKTQLNQIELVIAADADVLRPQGMMMLRRTPPGTSEIVNADGGSLTRDRRASKTGRLVYRGEFFPKKSRPERDAQVNVFHVEIEPSDPTAMVKFVDDRPVTIIIPKPSDESPGSPPTG